MRMMTRRSQKAECEALWPAAREPRSQFVMVSLIATLLLLVGCGDGANDEVLESGKIDSSGLVVSTNDISGKNGGIIGSPTEKSFPIQTGEGRTVEDAVVLYRDVEKAREVLRRLESQVQNLPDSLEQDRIDEMENEYKGVLWEASKIARRFWESHPDSDKADEVKNDEKSWVTALAAMGFQPAKDRMSQMVLTDLDDPSVDPDEKYRILFQAVQQAALAERANGDLAMARKFDQGADKLLEKFPDQILSVELYFLPLGAYHALKQSDDLKTVMGKIVSVLDGFEKKPGRLEDSARVRVDYAAQLFRLRLVDSARSQLSHASGLEVSQSLKQDIEIARETISQVIAAEAFQDALIGKKIDFPGLIDPGKKVHIVTFFNRYDRQLVGLMANQVAMLERFGGSNLGIVFALAPSEAEGNGPAPSELEAAIRSQFPPETSLRFRDISSPGSDGYEEFGKLQVLTLPQVWLVEADGVILQPRAGQKIQLHLHHYFSDLPESPASIFSQ